MPDLNELKRVSDLAEKRYIEADALWRVARQLENETRNEFLDARLNFLRAEHPEDTDVLSVKLERLNSNVQTLSDSLKDLAVTNSETSVQVAGPGPGNTKPKQQKRRK